LGLSENQSGSTAENQPKKFNIPEKMAAADDSLYPIAVLIDELRNEDVQVSRFNYCPLVPLFIA